MVFDKCENCSVRPKAIGKKWCQRCIDRYRRGNHLHRMISHIPLEYIEAELSDFLSITEIQNWDKKENLFFVGDPGTGKTRAMYAMAKACYIIGFSALVVEFNSVCSRIRDTYSKDNGETEDGIIKELSDLDVLFIDDLGLQSSVSDFAYITFYRILNRRIAECLATVISSNKTIDDIAESFDKRIASRLSLFTTIIFSGEDHRAMKNGVAV